MNFSELFIRRPIGTSLLALGLFLLGVLAYHFLPVAPLPRVDFPMVQVSASLPGADPSTMAATVAAPLERRLGQIAGITEMTSVSTVGSVSVSLQFDLDRKLEGAVKDVQSAVSAARGDLPSNLPFPPTYRKINPADSPVMILSLSSEYFSAGRLYEFADTLVAQRISQIDGVSSASITGAAKSGVRIRMNPGALALSGLGLEDVRVAVSQASVLLPKGSIEEEGTSYTIESNDRLTEADPYNSIVVAQKKGVPLRLSNLGSAIESVENTRISGLSGVTPAILIAVYKQSDANVIETVDRIQEVLPQVRKWLPPMVRLEVESNRTKTIRAAVEDVQNSLALSIGLVVLVMLLFLKKFWPTLIASLTVPLALAGTFGLMYLLDYSLDNLSLMALSISVGFVVDDAIVVIENIYRFIEAGESPFDAAIKGARQIGFTVVSITVSLVAVFIPLLCMGGLIGRLFHEFAVTLSLAVVVSAVISLSLTPSLCARFLRAHSPEVPLNRCQRGADFFITCLLNGYSWSLRWAFKRKAFMLLVTVASVCATYWLYGIVPKGFFPQQDTGMMMGVVEGAQDISFPAMTQIQATIAKMVVADAGVETVVSYLGGGNSARMFISLKPQAERGVSMDGIIARLRKATNQVPGVKVFIQGMQDIRVGGRTSKAQYQFAIQSSDLSELNEVAPKVLSVLKGVPGLQDVTSDQQTGGLKTSVVVDRDRASRLGVGLSEIDAAIYDAFGQRQISTIYKRYNQHRVILELEESYLEDPSSLERIYVRSNSGLMVPLASVGQFRKGNALLSVNHQGQFAAVTISFNLAAGQSLGEATQLIEREVERMRLPETIRTSFQGTAQVFHASLSTLPRLILWALIAVYLVLGILYESFIHPITILSTLPSAGLGALLALYYTRCDLSVVSFIGIILLMGIVKKNAIMMVDFAIETQRNGCVSAEEAAYEACIIRFRPIVMTTLAALFGCLPLALGAGVGAELRRPLGIAVVGGLIVSQVLTLYTTPIVYLAVERIRLFLSVKKPVSVERPAF